jgi:sugar/nucleoside kinase (ribokinase family)
MLTTQSAITLTKRARAPQPSTSNIHHHTFYATTPHNQETSHTMANITPQISCVSLGMLIIDEIRMPSKSPLLNVIGGSSTFVTLGLRLFTNNPSSVGCLVLAGSDFSREVEEEVKSWGTTLVLKKSPDKQSSRGLLVYEDDTFGAKTFEYTTPPLRATPLDLVNTPLLNAQAFHLFGSPEEVLNQIPHLLRLRRNHDPDLPTPFIVWEPLPSSCKPENRHKFSDACRLVDVFSPNHLELEALCSDIDDASHQDDVLQHLEHLGRLFTDSSIGVDIGFVQAGRGTIVIRAGEHGALALHCNTPAVHAPAFYERGDERVVDPTGAGNAFLGGYIAGWLRWGDVREALYSGSVAASFALAQIGLPGGEEEVSEQLGMARFAEYRARLEID